MSKDPYIILVVLGEERKLPAKYEVCPRCGGAGTHVNPNIDGNGLTAEDLEDSDFREDYLSGIYDVVCEHCGGYRVVAVPDLSRWLAEEVSAWNAKERADNEWRNEQINEMKMLGEWQ